MTDFATADLTDEFADRLRIVTPGFMDFGGSPRFCGPIETVQAYEDNTFVRQTLETLQGGFDVLRRHAQGAQSGIGSSGVLLVVPARQRGNPPQVD